MYRRTEHREILECVLIIFLRYHVLLAFQGRLIRREAKFLNLQLGRSIGVHFHVSLVLLLIQFNLFSA